MNHYFEPNEKALNDDRLKMGTEAAARADRDAEARAAGLPLLRAAVYNAIAAVPEGITFDALQAALPNAHPAVLRTLLDALRQDHEIDSDAATFWVTSA